MEFNFIEEVSKALDVLSVERLVRTSPIGAVRCTKCAKKLYTYVQARYVILKMFHIEQKYMDLYLCKEQEGENYHVTDLQKRIDKLENTCLRRVLETKKARLDKRYLRGDDVSPVCQDLAGERENLVVVDGRYGMGVPYPKALRRKILRALVFPVQGVRKPRAHLMRRQYKPFRRTPQRDTARRDYPRGETMTKMLSWANSHKFHVDSEHRSCRPRGEGDFFRRRNRAREVEAVRREIGRERAAEGLQIEGWAPWREDRHSVNKAACETVDFDGRYTVGEDGG